MTASNADAPKPRKMRPLLENFRTRRAPEPPSADASEAAGDDALDELALAEAAAPLGVGSEWRAAYAEGLRAGHEIGVNEGRARGREEGVADGERVGFAAGRADGFAEGLAKGRAEGLADGAERGRAEADAGHAAAEATAVAGLAQAMAAAISDRDALETRLRDEASEAVRATLIALAPRIAEAGFAEEAARQARDWLRRAERSDGVDALGKVLVAPEAFAAAELALERALNAEHRAVDLVADDALPAGAARVVWPGGFGEIDVAAALEGVLSALGAATDAAPEDPTDQEET